MAATLFMDSFFHYLTTAQALGKWTLWPANNSIIPGGGPNGANAVLVRFPPPQFTFIGPGQAIICVGFNYNGGFGAGIMGTQINNGMSGPGLGSLSNGKLQVNIGATTAISTVALTTGAWYYIEVYFSVTSDGVNWTLTYDVHVNGSSIMSGTIQSANAVTPILLTSFGLASPGGGTSALQANLYVTDGEFLGPINIACLFSADQGDLTQFTPTAVVPLRTGGSVINGASPLFTNLQGLYVMNEGTGNVDLNLIDATNAVFGNNGFGPNPTWANNPVTNVMDSIAFGGNGLLNAGHAASYDHLTVNKFTLSMKLLWNGGTNGAVHKGSLAAGVGGFDILFGAVSAGDVQVRITRATTPLSRVTSNATVPVGSWFQLTITWDGTGAGVATDLHIYINGVEALYNSTNNGTGAIIDESGNDLILGQAFSNSLFNGNMAYTALYKTRLLTTVEMGTLDAGLPITQGDVDLPNWRYVNDHTPDDNFSLVQTNTAGNKDLYFMDQILGNPTIKSAQLLTRVQKSDAGTASTKNIMKSAGVEQDGAEFFPGFGSFLYDREAYRKSPFTGLDWTVAEINALQCGVKRQT